MTTTKNLLTPAQNHKTVSDGLVNSFW